MQREREGIRRRRTRRAGEFAFRVTPPGGVCAEDAQASTNDGVLTVRRGGALT